MLTTSECVVVQNAVEHIREESDKWEVAVAIWLQRAVGGLTHSARSTAVQIVRSDLPAARCCSCPHPPSPWRTELCWSTSNVSSFLAWYAHYASPAEQAWATEFLYSTEHAPFYGAAAPFTLKAADGTTRTLPMRPCEEPGCRRCLTKRGGWAFRWVDYRWTPRASLRLDLDPPAHQKMASKPWPTGVLAGPQAIPAAASSSTPATEGEASPHRG